MWTFDNVPLNTLQKNYGFQPSAEWLDHVRLSCVRFSDGGSGSFISSDGLVLTNHHVALGQLQKSSSPQHNYLRESFYARTREQEIKSPDIYIEVLMSMANVTAEMKKRTAAASNDQELTKVRRGAIADIEKESKAKTGLEAEVVTLYGRPNIGSTGTNGTRTYESSLRRSSRSRFSGGISTISLTLATT